MRGKTAGSWPPSLRNSRVVTGDFSGSFPVRARIRASEARLMARQALSARRGCPRLPAALWRTRTVRGRRRKLRLLCRLQSHLYFYHSKRIIPRTVSFSSHHLSDCNILEFSYLARAAPSCRALLGGMTRPSDSGAQLDGSAEICASHAWGFPAVLLFS